MVTSNQNVQLINHFVYKMSEYHVHAHLKVMMSSNVLSCLTNFQKSKEKKQQIVTINKLNEGVFVGDSSVIVVCSWFEV